MPQLKDNFIRNQSSLYKEKSLYPDAQQSPSVCAAQDVKQSSMDESALRNTQHINVRQDGVEFLATYE